MMRYEIRLRVMVNGQKEKEKSDEWISFTVFSMVELWM